METRVYNCAAAWTLVGSFCGSSGKVKNPLMGAVPNQAKVLSRKIPLASTTKQHPLQGFFTSIAAVLHTIASAQVGGVELTDDSGIPGVGWGRGVSQPRRTGRDGHGVICVATGLRSRADGWTGFRHIVQRSGMQDRQRTGIAGRDNPKPQH